MASTPSRALPAAEPSVAGHAEQQGCHECRMLADAPVLHLVGHILFVRERTLMAQPVDPNSLQPAGDVFPVIEQVSSIFSYFLYSVSRNGIILYLPGSTNRRQNAIFDRTGKQVSAIGGPANTQGRVALS